LNYLKIFSLESYIPFSFKIGFKSLLISSKSSLAIILRISPAFKILLISYRKFSYNICVSEIKNKVDIFLDPAYLITFFISSFQDYSL